MTLPTALPPIDPPMAPPEPMPAGACDAHVHLLGDDAAFPLWDGRVENPAPGTLDDWIGRYDRHRATLGISRTVVAQSIFYGADNAVTVAAVDRLGRERTRGIGLVRDGADGQVLDALAASGVVGVRLNYVHGGVLTWPGVIRLAPLLADRGMHVQMLMHSHLHMADLAEDIRRLPVPVCFDHMGWPDLGLGTGDSGFHLMCDLLAEGRIWVKLSAPYRLCPPPWDRAAPFIEALVAANPERCLWGSDWPHIMLADATQPDSGALLAQLIDLVPDAETRHRILVRNTEALYGFDPA